MGHMDGDELDELDGIRRAARVNIEARPVSIDGARVTRPASPASRTVHSFLRYLCAKGIDGVPEPLDLQEGRETLRLVKGASGGEAWYQQHGDQGLASAARFLRRIHDAGRGWTPPDDAVWGSPAVPGSEIVYCHGDVGPWNFVWQDREAIGLIDWDYLHPAPRLDDIAYALQWFVPMRSDEFALGWHHFPEVPDRRQRIRVFLEAYGALPAFDVIEAVTSRMQSTSDLVRHLAGQGQEPQRTWVAEGALARYAAEIAWVHEHSNQLSWT
jgi:hypothetical protein